MTEFKKIRKALIPVAGLGTRLMPATKAIPKELLPLLNKPLIQYIVEEAVSVGIKEIVLITRSGKESIENHFDSDFEIESLLKNSGKKGILKNFPKQAFKNISFESVRQGEPLGLGHAILSAKHVLRKDEPFSVFLPDEYLFSLNQCTDFRKMIINYQQTGKGQILAEKIKNKDIPSYGIIDIGGKKITQLSPKQIINFFEKPSIKSAPSNLRIIGRYILPYEILKYLSNQKPGKDNEIQLTDALKKGVISKELKFDAVLSNSRVFDCGSLEGFLGANVMLASKNKLMKKYLKEILK